MGRKNLFPVLLICAIIGFAIPVAGLAGSAAAESGERPIRFGLTAVVVKENLRFLDKWAVYLAARLGRPVEFVRRRTYREVMDMLDAATLDFAWICGYPFTQKRDPEFIEPLVVPVYAGEPLYRSYIIVRADSPYGSLADLENRVFAFSDPDSNSGHLYPRFLLAERNHRPEIFFRHTFFTFNHAETIEAVADGVADGGAVDSYIWDYLDANRPGLTARTRIIERSPKFGFPPLVSRRGVDPETIQRMRQVFVDMANDPEGKRFVAGLILDGFGVYSPGLYESIRQMAERARLPQEAEHDTAQRAASQ